MTGPGFKVREGPPLWEMILGAMSGDEWVVFIVSFVGTTVVMLLWYYLLVRPRIDEFFEEQRNLAKLKKECFPHHPERHPTFSDTTKNEQYART